LVPSVSAEQKKNILSEKIGFAPATLQKTPLSFSKDAYKGIDKLILESDLDEKNRKRPADLENTHPIKKQKIVCASCGVDIEGLRYHCTKDTSIDVCKVCYFDARFPNQLLSGDFIKLETETDFCDNVAWSAQESYLLLEGVELYDDDWNKIAQHVKTKTRDQCVLHFLKVCRD
jgi:SWI/SNF related-matrix-associated actin-dependent regulator of chromatin subfamily C